MFSSPTQCDIDGSTVSNERASRLALPYIFRGRDFNATNDLFLHKILQFHETWYREPDININDTKSKDRSICKCDGFVKCQHVTVCNPSILTLEFGQKTWMEILKNNNKINMNIKNKRIHVGKTSETGVTQLIYNNNIPLINATVLSCHIDLNTNKPITVCNIQRNNTRNELSLIKTDKEKQNLFKFREDLIYSMNKMTETLNGININKDYLFRMELQLFYTDIDVNFHVNQSIYGAKIENAMYQYDDEFFNSKYNVKEITLNYVKEMIIDRNQCKKNNNILPFCVVKIIKDIEIKNNGDFEREIIGIIEKDNILRAQFRLILIPYKHDRLFAVRSRL